MKRFKQTIPSKFRIKLLFKETLSIKLSKLQLNDKINDSKFNWYNPTKITNEYTVICTLYYHNLLLLQFLNVLPFIIYICNIRECLTNSIHFIVLLYNKS